MGVMYSNNIYNQCKFLFVAELKSAKTISNDFGGKPAKQTIQLWAVKKDKKTGKSWHDLRAEQRDNEYEGISPANLAKKILNRIMEILHSPDFNEKSADALAKLQSSLDKITDNRYQIPVMYHMLSELSVYFKTNYPKIATREFRDAIQDFKNHLRLQLLGK